MEHSLGNYISDKVEDKQPRTILGLKGLAKPPKDDFEISYLITKNFINFFF